MTSGIRNKGTLNRGFESLKGLWFDRVQPALRERFVTKEFIGHGSSKYGFAFMGNIFRLSQVPFLKDRIPWIDPQKSNVSWLPINADIEGAGSMALSIEVMDRLIETASYRAIVNFCPCRQVENCANYPVDIGCLMMGESARELPGKTAREVGVDEAKAHVRKATDAGLIPVVGKARIDNDLFLIRDQGRLLTTCFCCECCCIARYMTHIPEDMLDRVHRPVEGLSISVTDDCVGCGECVDACYMGALEVRDGRAVISSMCRVCGRCALRCPQHAIRLKLDNKNAADDVVARIRSFVDF